MIFSRLLTKSAFFFGGGGHQSESDLLSGVFEVIVRKKLTTGELIKETKGSLCVHVFFFMERTKCLRKYLTAGLQTFLPNIYFPTSLLKVSSWKEDEKQMKDSLKAVHVQTLWAWSFFHTKTQIPLKFQGNIPILNNWFIVRRIGNLLVIKLCAVKYSYENAAVLLV